MKQTLEEIDLDHLKSWIGREETAEDTVTPGLLERYRATFGDWLHEPVAGVPLGLHWCLAPAAVRREDLGADGHPKRGGFLPPVPFENRMWAGGEIVFRAPIRIGEAVRRLSRIAAIAPKEGRTGPLVFVSVAHRFMVGDQVSIEERQDIVYRPAQPCGPRAAAVTGERDGAFVGDPVTLFRYSALTFNGHRIHYDHPYVIEREGYGGLVVHGPLQATLLMNAAARIAGTAAIRFAYRGLSPLIAGEPVSVGREQGRVWLEKLEGTVTFEAWFEASEGAAA